jgi:tRNA pseudouridine38-40 synthase
MNRYFLELSYKGEAYAGFQVQQNARTIQSEVQQALEVYFRQSVILTGSSRTDAGVHALQNYFHFDLPVAFPEKALYNLNALLGRDIAIRKVWPMQGEAHCRFHATGREYRYYLYQHKDPFLSDRAYYFPYRLDVDRMREAAAALLEFQDFSSFSKRNTQVKTFICKLEYSEWAEDGDCLVYKVRANRFLRGMVRGLVGTMLQVGRGRLSVEQFRELIGARSSQHTNFAVPGHGLFLVSVSYPPGYLEAGGQLQKNM